MMVSFVVCCIMGVWLHCAGLLEISELLGETRQLSTEVQWEWQANDGEWKEYAATENRMIEVWASIFADSNEPRLLCRRDM